MHPSPFKHSTLTSIGSADGHLSPTAGLDIRGTLHQQLKLEPQCSQSLATVASLPRGSPVQETNVENLGARESDVRGTLITSWGAVSGIARGNLPVESH